jgi:hypothetical protein
MNGNLSLNTSETNYYKAAFYDMNRRFWDEKVKKNNDEMIIFRKLPDMLLADPFARNCPDAGLFTNDIDPETKATHHMDAIEFMKILDTSSFDGVIFDPPFSKTQAKRYPSEITNVYTKAGYVKSIMTEIERVLKPGGYLLKFGFNSTKHRHHFDLEHMWVVNHGGNHNDTIVTLWKKVNHNIYEWSEEE